MNDEEMLEIEAAGSTEVVPGTTGGVETSKARGVAEIMASMSIAKRFPRDEQSSFSKVMRACARPGLAEMSSYEYKRGTSQVFGPSIHLAKAIAQAWGNIEFGWKEIERKEGWSLCEAYAWDMENNTRTQLSFSVKHWRDTRSGGHALSDERDVYELCANQAARRMRACLLSIIPGDVVDAALSECEKTIKGKTKEPLADRARKMVVVFQEHGVTIEMIETLLGHKLDAITETQLAKLRRIYTSLKDGAGSREDFFKPAEDRKPKLRTEAKPEEKQPEAPNDPELQNK